mgnify:CR=1 FL=1
MKKFQIIINILSTKDYAADIAQSIKQTLENNSTITNIQLTRIHDEL